ncbi:MAG: ATP-dependent helicase [Alteromonadaceae bacterium]|uniref:DEAD/DEAH box helicase n=1 Tax=Paraglaciecola chathamensis TaxID=368405 RepID=UPI000C52BC04|nr:DEAD/DEAH box helicase [Paraglaciecola agarilytica]MBN27432.1 ATP-dependent helicase [Alteromonadaceae bacterium]|tara:strand:+ start:17285 stop:19042 length:1758 start_codon:yes stop_codon:yes gene_type:complete
MSQAFILRDYQTQAVDAALAHFRQSEDPAVIVLPTGAGKSLVIAELSRLAKGHVICLAHVKELVEQNHAKFLATGSAAGIFSAGLGQKDRNVKTTFASIQSLSANLAAFHVPASLIIIDECHRVGLEDSAQYNKTLAHFRRLNPKVKILGLTATPYRLGSGWIYQHHYHGYTRPSDDSFFKKCIFELPLQFMVKNQYLTPPIHYDAAVAHYDFSLLTESLDGEQNTDDIALNELIHKHPRVTKAVTEQILQLSQDREGVMIFAATVDHAKEICAYLPEQQTALITGTTKIKQRDTLIAAFKAKHIKYLVNVSVLTTGFDAPHVDVIAILRPTQSISLFQQIVGRGLRLSPGKKDCLVLDYTNNGYDIFQPEIGEKKPTSDSIAVQIHCPQCDFANAFWGRKDAQGHILEHFGRRCQGLIDTPDGETQCNYRFRFKHCPYCNQENDIAARQCQHCNEKLIDPDDILRKALNLNNNKVLRCAAITPVINSAEKSIKITYHDEDGLTLSETFRFNYKKARQRFNDLFARRLASGTQSIQFDSLDELQKFLPYLPAPDFVIAKKQKHHWQVTERLFDYQGPYRKANTLG